MREQGSEERALADRLVSYADAVAALAFVGVSGLGVAVADPDTRAESRSLALRACSSPRRSDAPARERVRR